MRDLICISCPVGCRMQVEKRGDEICVSGNRCRRGQVFAQEEMTNPKRMLTTVIAVAGEPLRLLPVISRAPFPKEKMHEGLAVLRDVVRARPIEEGSVVVADLLHTGIDIVAAKTIEG